MIDSLEAEIADLHASFPNDDAKLEASRLRTKLAETERELQRMIRRTASGAPMPRGVVEAAAGRGVGDSVGSEGRGDEESVRLVEENRWLKEENEKLSSELQAFDLDFFEEIEDLKYKYSEAARKLLQYEGRSRESDGRDK